MTHQRLKDIDVKDMQRPSDISACERTSRVYIADWKECVWRVSSDGGDIMRWLSSDTLSPCTVSVTSSRLLVTSWDTNQLIQFDGDGDELRRVDLPDDMTPHHAVESPTGTFIFSHSNAQLKQWQVSEVNTGGQLLRQFSGSRVSLVTADSRGNIFVADRKNRRILVLNAELALRRVIIDGCQLPESLCYSEQSGQLLVGFKGSIAVFDVLRR